MPESSYKVKDFTQDLQKRGILTFSLNDIRERFPSFSEAAIKSALRRISGNGSIMPVRKGFYTIIPLGYALRGGLPPELFIDDLMKRLRRPYYVGLLNAAAYRGAAHQQPHAFSVITAPPALRDTVKKGINIKFITTRKMIPHAWLKPFRTESGDIQVSAPELTAADLITHQKEIGGLSRASTILHELAESLNFKHLDEQFFDFVPDATVQRLGYLLESVLERPKLANVLYAKAQNHKCKFQRIPLKNGKEKGASVIDARWKVIVNEEIEIDDL
jgi:predicted transcriptional regulator of viral defense system